MCVCVGFDGGWLNGALNYQNTQVALVMGEMDSFNHPLCTCECNFHLSYVFPPDFIYELIFAKSIFLDMFNMLFSEVPHSTY